MNAFSFSRDDGQVVVHFVAGKNLAELRDEQPFAQMAGELGQAVAVLLGGVAHQVAEGAFLPSLLQASANDLVDRLGPLHVFQILAGETFIDVGHPLAVGRFLADNLDVLGGQLAGPFHGRGNVALLVSLGPLAGLELETEQVAALEQSRRLHLDGVKRRES